MLAFKYRFHGYGSLRFVYKNGKTFRSRLITAKYSDNPHRKNPRFSVVVSKKVLKSAVGRNRIRRRIYESIRTSFPEEVAVKDIVFIVISSEISNLEQSKLTELTGEILKQTGLYKK